LKKMCTDRSPATAN